MTTRRLALAAAIGLFLAAVFAFRVRNDMSDLRVCVRAGERLLAGEMLYRPSDGHLQFKYSPPAAVLFVSLSIMPFEAAKLIWYVLEFAGIAGICLMSLKILSTEKKRAISLLTFTFLVLFNFLAREIELGQINILILFLLTLMVRLLVGGRDGAAGLAWGFSLFSKPYALIFLPYLLLKKKTRAAATGLALFATGLAVPAIFLGLRENFAVLKERPAACCG
jgi:hypothetical protein